MCWGSQWAAAAPGEETYLALAAAAPEDVLGGRNLPGFFLAATECLHLVPSPERCVEPPSSSLRRRRAVVVASSAVVAGWVGCQPRDVNPVLHPTRAASPSSRRRRRELEPPSSRRRRRVVEPCRAAVVEPSSSSRRRRRVVVAVAVPALPCTPLHPRCRQRPRPCRRPLSRLPTGPLARRRRGSRCVAVSSPPRRRRPGRASRPRPPVVLVAHPPVATPRPCVVATTVVAVVGRCRRRRRHRHFAVAIVAAVIVVNTLGHGSRHLRPRALSVPLSVAGFVIVSPSSAARRRRCRR